MNRKILLLRIAYWWGILADAAMVILYLFPKLFLQTMNVNLQPDAGFSYGLVNAAPVMVGWTLLLFWADRKPVERKVILLLTLPIVAGYFLVELYGISIGLTSPGAILPLFISQMCMSVLFVFSYLNAGSSAAIQQA